MAYSGGQITRQGLSGIPRALYGDFSGRKADRSIPTLTRLGLCGIPRGLYGTFTGKTEAIPAAIAPRGGGGGWDEDEEILAVIIAASHH